MHKGLVVTRTIKIHARPGAVWDALINPKKIEQYLFGTEAISDWKPGSSIRYRGVWMDTPYEDKGIILQMVKEKIFQSTYWSPMSGTNDIPENYATVTYELTEENGDTVVTLTQDNCKSESQKKHLEENWGMVLEGLKKLVES